MLHTGIINYFNMTKITITGEQPKEKKPIELVWYINSKGDKTPAESTPRCFKNIEVTLRKDDFDIFYCYNNDRTIGALYLGYYNDGVI